MAAFFAVLVVSLAAFVGANSPYIPLEVLRAGFFREAARVEGLVLKELGLPPRSSIPANLTMPKYILDMYEVLERNATNTSTHAEFDTDKAISSNLIEACPEKERVSSSKQLTERIRFSNPDLKKDAVVNSAELRLFRELPVDRNRSFVVELYQVSRLETARQSGHKSKVGEVQISGMEDDDHWVIFDVTETTKGWVFFPHLNHGFELVVSDENGTLVHPATVGLKKFTGQPEREALLVVFAEENLEIQLTPVDRVRRTIGAIASKYQFPGTEENQIVPNGVCSRRSYYVDFQKIGWSHIVRPLGYFAYYCGGECPKFFTSAMNMTNHASLQALMHYLYGGPKYPPVSCVPVSYEPLVVAFPDRNGHFKIRTYKNMVAKHCGCH
eukprot:m.308884 g.308884  ORF g.308884 m.308884 type:complete len:384 (+) comp44981_c0_seq1:90-1241(+)